MRSRRLFFIFLSLAIAIQSFSQSDSLKIESDEVIYWSENNLLKYIDFQARQDSSYNVDGLLANATAATEIRFSVFTNDDGNTCFKVMNVFLRNKSWMVKKTPYVLQHEQLHFDISEVYARRIRKRLSQLIGDDMADVNVLKDEIQILLKERMFRQQQYDHDTDHGNLFDQQQRWNKMIKVELIELDGFS